MKKGDNIFVYGTLRRGERMDLSKNEFEFGIKYVGETDINGLLYHLGGYPGAKVEGGAFDENQPIIHGDLFEITDDGIVLILDTYEGYPYLYQRLETETRCGNMTWVYIYNSECSEKSQIVSGDWQKQKRAA